MTTDSIHKHRILIIDFGSQYTQLIARRVREIGVYCEIFPYDINPEEIKKFHPNGIILSGGPETVIGESTPSAPQIVFDLACPLLGICYGMHTMAAQLGGEVESSDHREFGYANVTVCEKNKLFDGIEDRLDDHGDAQLDVWMSHGDKVTKIPEGFSIIASTKNAPISAMADESRHYYGLQFHPEVTHTEQGHRLLERFIKDICGCEALWTSANIIEDSIDRVKEQVGDDEVILGLSGGVDSSVVAALLHEAIGDQLTCVFVDTGLLREGEFEQVQLTMKKHMGIKVIAVDARDRFLQKLKGVEDPEQKRKVIGNEFIDVFDEQSKKLPNAKWLALGSHKLIGWLYARAMILSSNTNTAPTGTSLFFFANSACSSAWCI